MTLIKRIEKLEQRQTVTMPELPPLDDYDVNVETRAKVALAFGITPLIWEKAREKLLSEYL